MRPLLILAAAAVLSAPGFARDREFDSLVRQFEAHYGVCHLRIPLLGFANFIVKVGRPGGASDLKLAVFEEMGRASLGEPEESLDFVQQTLGPDWHPFIRTWEPRKNEWTAIYSNFERGRWKLLIVTADRADSTLVRLKLNPNAMKHWIERPRQRARYRTHD